ncbi:ion channel [Chroococcidiopsis sp. CCALA 051]|uniref:ion channel n=1 Tax=Chroococcidiopsis sp. CCALA 051 TaxID=869949 RepID=UPI000D0DA0D6|nr:ion channel [Chroococcidiopsis sp. CCALA 051]
MEIGMAIDDPIESRWGSAVLQLVLLSFGLTILFALVYWGIDGLNWGLLQDREGKRAVRFLPFLYFSIETFFRIGYGTQVPLGAMWIAVTLEALSHFVVEILFIAHFATLSLNKLVSLSNRTRLENLLNRF